MALECPKPVEVFDSIQFKLHDKFTVFESDGEMLGYHPVNLLAIASNYGLMFAGNFKLPELKVILLKNLVECKGSGKPLHVRVFPLPDLPISVSASSDGTMLAVNYIQNSSGFLQIYNIPSFTSANVKTVTTIRLSPEINTYAYQILWNPVVSNSLAVVLSNGALLMYTLQDNGNYQFNSLDQQNQVKCGCWSPKGKQIVLGFPGGKLVQYKPDLTPAKTIPGPANILPQPSDTIAVQWLSTFQFAVAFLQKGDGTTPSLYIVNAPKGGSPKYTNYFDICYSNAGPRPHQINFMHIQPWNMLLVTSANGFEIGVLGTVESGDTPTWVQYTLLDEARIEMPLTVDKEDTFTIGIVFDTSSTHQVTIDEKKFPIMPMIHILSTHGQLISYNFLNLSRTDQGVCSPPNPISDTTGLSLFQSIEEMHRKGKSLPPAQVNTDTSFGFNPSGQTSTPEGKGKNKVAAEIGIKPTFSFSMPATNNSGSIGQQVKSSISIFDKNQVSSESQQPKTQTVTESLQEKMQQTIAKPAEDKNKPLFTLSAAYNPPPSQSIPSITNLKPQAPTDKSAEKPQMNSSEMDEIVKQMIAVQINSFNQELQQLGNQSKGLLTSIGHPNEMKTYTKRLNDLQEICEQAKNREFEVDVQNLRHSLIEAYVMLAECRSKLEMYNNPDITRLTRMSAHDPINRRQLAKLQGYNATNQVLMQQLQKLIDEQWSNYQDLVHRNSRTKIQIPCLEGIYQRMTKLKDLTMKQRKKLNFIKSKLRENGLLYTDSRNIITNTPISKPDNTMESLADSILSMTLSHVVEAKYSKLSDEKLRAITEIVKDRKIIKIKPQRPDRIGIKSEVILETKQQTERKKREGAATNIEKMELERMKTNNDTRVLTKPTATKAVSWTDSSQPFPALSNQNISNPGLKFGGGSFVKTPLAIAKTNDSPEVQQETSVAPFSFMNQANATPAFTSFANNSQVSISEVKSSSNNKTVSTTKSASILPISFAAEVIDRDSKSAADGALKFPLTSSANQVSENKKNQNVAAEIKPLYSPLGETQLSDNKSCGDNSSYGLLSMRSVNSEQNKSNVFSFSSSGGSFSIPSTYAPLNLNFVSVSDTPVSKSTNNLSASNKPATFSGTSSKENSGGFLLGSSHSDFPKTNTTPEIKNTPIVCSTDPTDALSGAFNICKPSSQEKNDFTKTTSSKDNSVFGFGGSTILDSTTKTPFSIGGSSTGKFTFTGFNSDFLSTTQSTVTVTSDTTTLSSTPKSSSSTFSFATDNSTQNISTAKTTEVTATCNTIAATSASSFGISSVAPSSTSTNITASVSSASPSSGQLMFGGTPSFLNATPSTGSIFGVATTSSIATSSTTTGSIFSGIPKPDQSLFGNQTTVASTNISSVGEIFGNATVSSPPLFSEAAGNTSGGSIFAGNSTFGANTNSSGSIFGGTSTNANPFGSAIATSPGSSVFGKPVEGTNIFGNQSQSVANSSGASLFGQSAFGQNNQPSGSMFANQPAAFGSTSGFGFTSPSSGNSIFGGGGVGGTQTAFGGTASGFGSFSAATPLPFGSPTPGPFAQGGPSIAQSGFGSQTAQPSFAKPLFGGAQTFGSQPSFGGAATFGKGFGTFSSPTAGNTAFSAPTQKNNLFEALGSSDTGLSFGNLAHNTNANTTKPTFGGSSFMNYRA